MMKHDSQRTVHTEQGDEAALIAALCNRDERAFLTLVNQYQQSLLGLALNYVTDHAVAEEVVQETWLAVLRGIDRFEGRSTLKTWIFTILVNRAKTRGVREKRSRSFSAYGFPHHTDDPNNGDPNNVSESSVAIDRFQTADQRWPGHWQSMPQRWPPTPEDGMLWQEMQHLITKQIQTLPPNQQAVITLRDIEGFPTDEICIMLNISEANQRVLLHRARSRVRSALEHYYAQHLIAI